MNNQNDDSKITRRTVLSGSAIIALSLSGCFDDEPHEDEPHEDEPHEDEPHEDEPHEDEPHEDEPHEDEPHEDEPHEDEPHEDEPHEDEPHEDEPHEDEPHEDEPHEDEPHEDEPHEDEPHEEDEDPRDDKDDSDPGDGEEEEYQLTVRVTIDGEEVVMNQEFVLYDDQEVVEDATGEHTLETSIPNGSYQVSWYGNGLKWRNLKYKGSREIQIDGEKKDVEVDIANGVPETDIDHAYRFEPIGNNDKYHLIVSITNDGFKEAPKQKIHCTMTNGDDGFYEGTQVTERIGPTGGQRKPYEITLLGHEVENPDEWDVEVTVGRAAEDTDGSILGMFLKLIRPE